MRSISDLAVRISAIEKVRQAGLMVSPDSHSITGLGIRYCRVNSLLGINAFREKFDAIRACAPSPKSRKL
jgi:hypothetical protein